MEVEWGTDHTSLITIFRELARTSSLMFKIILHSFIRKVSDIDSDIDSISPGDIEDILKLLENQPISVQLDVIKALLKQLIAIRKTMGRFARYYAERDSARRIKEE